MAIKPTIVYVESSYKGFSSDNNPDRDALAYFLREHCGCEVVLYDSSYDFEEKFQEVKTFALCGSLILVIVAQEEYSDGHLDVIRKARTISKELPIVVIPEGWGDERFKGVDADDQIYIYNHSDPQLAGLVNRLVAGWEEPESAVNYFGAETKAEQTLLISQLEEVYQKHYEDEMLTATDPNTKVVAEALRIRLLPPELIKEEFDNALERKPREFAKVEPSVYLQELDRVCSMSESERKDFDTRLMRARGYEPAEGGGVYVIRASCGPDVDGFAIDPVTLEYIIVSGFGKHHLAKDRLARRIEAIEGLKHGKHAFELPEDQQRECHQRLMAGLIFNDIDGFTVPILQLYREDADGESVKKVASFIKGQLKFIPVTPSGDPI